MTKPQLQRIEATLSHLSGSSERTATAPSYSFKIAVSAADSAAAVHPQSIAAPDASLPNLPKFKPPSLSSHHNAANPALAGNLLKTIAAKVSAWQTELQQVMRQIQALYTEGPIIDGWLDTHARSTPVADSTLRHAEADRLMDYVQKICQAQPAAAAEPSAGYRLCGLDTDGKLWSRSCPPDQLPHVSLAIARYQKLRQLLVRKQQIETQLNDLAQTLIPIQTRLQALS